MMLRSQHCIPLSSTLSWKCVRNIVTFGECKLAHYENMNAREWLLVDESVDELYEYKNLGVVKNYTGSFSSNVQDNIFNNKKFLDYLKEIYPSQLTVEKANKSDHLADYLDLTFIIDSGGKLSTRLYDRRDDFDFHIVNFLFLSSNIPSGPSYGVYISQLIRYARCCSHYDDFRYRHKCLVDRLLSQGYKALRLEKSFKKFYGRYQDLIEKYRRSVNAMVSDSFPGQFLFNI